MNKNEPTTEYRNRKDLRVLSAAELMSEKSLAKRVEMMVENRNAVFIRNLDYLCKKHEIKQARLCEDKLEQLIHSAQLSTYKKTGKDIPMRVMSLVASAFGYTIEQLCGQLLEEEEVKTYVSDAHALRPFEEYRNFLGIYEVAYFSDSDRAIARPGNAAACLEKGLLTVYLTSAANSVPVVKAELMLGCSPNEKDKLMSQLLDAERKGGDRAFVCAYETAAKNCAERYCKGELLLTPASAILRLQQQRGNNELTITLHNRAGMAKSYDAYCCGLGTLSHSSTGEYQIPRVQAIALSMQGFDSIPPAELAEHLLLTPATVHLDNEVKEIITYMHFIEDRSTADFLSEADLDFLLESFMTRKMAQIMKRSVCSSFAVTWERDLEFYNLCRSNRKER